MSFALDSRIRSTGTRFRLYAQARHLPAFSEPETVVLSLSPGEIQAGPADSRLFVVDAIGKRPYGLGGGFPQWAGASRPPVRPAADGHFDAIDVNSREFSSATMYATVRRVLDIWEDYFGHQIEWFFALDFERLELIPLIEWDNAQSGGGFLEFGFGRNVNGGIDHSAPYCQNFDVLAHELGHNILFTEVGIPNSGAETDEYGGFQESGGDLTAIVASLHFDSVVDHMLAQSKGNLFTVNELSRLGELPSGREIRVAFNNERMSTVSLEPHDLSLPLTGAIFDIFVDAFQSELVARGLISADLARRSTHGTAPPQDLSGIQAEFEAAYTGEEAKFKAALIEARDFLGRLLARTWSNLDANSLSYRGVGRALLTADQQLAGGKHRQSIRECLQWREIALVDGPLMVRQLVGPAGSSAETVHRLPDLQMTAEAASLTFQQASDIVIAAAGRSVPFNTTVGQAVGADSGSRSLFRTNVQNGVNARGFQIRLKEIPNGEGDTLAVVRRDVKLLATPAN